MFVKNNRKDRVTHLNVSVAINHRRDNKMYHLCDKYLCLIHKDIQSSFEDLLKKNSCLYRSYKSSNPCCGNR